MCFSLEADLVAGTIVTAAGVVAVAEAPARRFLPLAALPVVLGTHLLVEATVWSGLEGGWWAGRYEATTVAYLAVALVVLPVLAPVAFALVETGRERRRAWAFVALGVVVAVALGRLMAEGPVGAHIDGHHISYHVPGPPSDPLVWAYVVATCGPALLSTRSVIRAFGWANLVAVSLLGLLDQTAMISLWCAWATVASVLVVAFLRAERGRADALDASRRRSRRPSPLARERSDAGPR